MMMMMIIIIIIIPGIYRNRMKVTWIMKNVTR
jgi:hypothetical protein